MRLLVKVLPLPGASRSRGAKQFNLLVGRGATFADVWRLIETRFQNVYPHEAQDFAIKKLQDIYGCDIVLEDVVDLFFEDEPDQQRRMIHVVQAPLDRDMSVALGSGLRPPNALKRVLPPAAIEANKRRRVERDLYGCAVEDMQPDRPVRSNESDGDPVIVEDSQRETASPSEDRLHTVAKSESPGEDERSLMDVPAGGGFRLPGLPTSSLRDRPRQQSALDEPAWELPNGHLSPIAESPSVSELGLERTRAPSSQLSSTPPSAQRPRESRQREGSRHITHSLEVNPMTTSITSQRTLQPLQDRTQDNTVTPPLSQSPHRVNPSLPATQTTPAATAGRKRARESPLPEAQGDTATPSHSKNAPTSPDTQSGTEETQAAALVKLKELTGDEPYGETAGIWTAKEDEILLTAHAAGLCFEEISTKWLPNRGKGGVRKRYARVKSLQDSTAPSPTTEPSARKRKIPSGAAAELERLNEKHRAKEAEKATGKKKQEACIQRQIKAKKFKDKEKELSELFHREEAREEQKRRETIEQSEADQAKVRKDREALEKSLSALPRSSHESVLTTSQGQPAEVTRQSKLPFPRQKANNLKTYGRSPTKRNLVDDPFAVPSDGEDESRNVAAANPTKCRSTRFSKAMQDASKSSLPDKNVSPRRSVSFNEEVDISNRYAQPREPNHGTESPRSSILKSAKSKETSSGLRDEGLQGTPSQKPRPTERPGSWSFDKLDRDEATDKPNESAGQPDELQPGLEEAADGEAADGEAVDGEDANEEGANKEGANEEAAGEEAAGEEAAGEEAAGEEAAGEEAAGEEGVGEDPAESPESSPDLGEKVDGSQADSQKTAARYVSSSPSSHSRSEAASPGGSPPASSPPAIRTTAGEGAHVPGSPSGSDTDSNESDSDGEEAPSSSPTRLPPSPSPAPVARKPLRSAMKGSRTASRSASSNTPSTATGNGTSDGASTVSRCVPASTTTQKATPRATSRTSAAPTTNTPPPLSMTPRPLSRVASGASTPRAANRSGLHSLSYLKSQPPPEIPKPVYTGPMPKAKTTAVDESSSDSDSSSSSSSDSDDNGAGGSEAKKPRKSRWSGLVDLANANSFPM